MWDHAPPNPQMKIKPWTNEEFITAVSISNSLADVLRNLNIDTKSYGHYKMIKRYIKKLNCNTSHFLSKEDLRTLQNDKLALSNKARPKATLKDLLVENGEYSHIKTIKKLIIKDKILPYECVECKLSTWRGKPISLHIDHISGNPTDNRLTNLRFLCPNCHSQTDTYCGKSRNKKQNICKCGKILYKESNSCSDCRVRKTKINWKPIDDLIKSVEEIGYEATGRSFGVSGNAVKKHIKKHTVLVV